MPSQDRGRAPSGGLRSYNAKAAGALGLSRLAANATVAGLAASIPQVPRRGTLTDTLDLPRGGLTACHRPELPFPARLWRGARGSEQDPSSALRPPLPRVQKVLVPPSPALLSLFPPPPLSLLSPSPLRPQAAAAIHSIANCLFLPLRYPILSPHRPLHLHHDDHPAARQHRQ